MWPQAVKDWLLGAAGQLPDPMAFVVQYHAVVTVSRAQRRSVPGHAALAK